MSNNNPSRKPDDSTEGRDLDTGKPSSHPIATGTGAVAGGLAGGAIGSAAGPVGTALGAGAGAVVGGVVGRAAGEEIDPTEQDKYWRSKFSTRPYAKEFTSYDDVAPAYRYGWESASKAKGRSFDDAESTLRKDWDKVKGKAELSWDKAKLAVKDAWDRVVPGRGR